MRNHKETDPNFQSYSLAKYNAFDSLCENQVLGYPKISRNFCFQK